MFGSNALEVVISVIFVYLLLSLLCSTINEQVIVRILSLRANVLQEGIVNMLGNPALVAQFYNHPLIRALSQDTLYLKSPMAKLPPTASQTGKIRKPSYIPSDIFALALQDILQQQRDATGTGIVTPSIPSDLEEILKKLNIDVDKDLVGLESWYNSTMERVSGWYKRRVQIIIFLLGLIVVVGLNIDTISLITSVSNNETARATLVSAAQGYTTQHNPNLVLLQSDINQVQPMVGWYALPTNFQGWLLKIVGVLATTFAISLGAPFWFDVLNKFMSFRSSGPPPSSSSPNLLSLTASPPVVVVKNDGTSATPTTPTTLTTPLPQDTAVNGTEMSH